MKLPHVLLIGVLTACYAIAEPAQSENASKTAVLDPVQDSKKAIANWIEAVKKGKYLPLIKNIDLLVLCHINYLNRNLASSGMLWQDKVHAIGTSCGNHRSFARRAGAPRINLAAPTGRQSRRATGSGHPAGQRGCHDQAHRRARRLERADGGQMAAALFDPPTRRLERVAALRRPATRQ